MAAPHRHRVPLLAAALRLLLWTAAALAAAALILSGNAGRVTAQLLLSVLIGAPLLRVAYLSLRWARLGDWRYAAAGALLLTVTAVGVAVSL
jgi:hypothetical protein